MTDSTIVERMLKSGVVTPEMIVKSLNDELINQTKMCKHYASKGNKEKLKKHQEMYQILDTIVMRAKHYTK